MEYYSKIFNEIQDKVKLTEARETDFSKYKRPIAILRNRTWKMRDSGTHPFLHRESIRRKRDAKTLN
jgi:hypothetical protein